MKVILKTVSGGAPFTVEIGDDATIGELLNKCGEENNYDCSMNTFSLTNALHKRTRPPTQGPSPSRART